MFKLLKDPNATVTDFSKSHLQIEAAKTKLNTEREEKYSELVELQMEAMSGESVANKIKKRQAELTDIDAKLDTCERGLNRIKERIAFLIPEETQQKIDRLNKDYESLKAEEAELYKRFFSKCAEAIAIKEQIKGKEYNYYSHSGTMTEKAPELRVSAYDQLMNKEDSKFLVAEVKKFNECNDGFVPVADRKDVIRREIYSAQSLLDNCRDGVTPEIIDRVIKQHRGGVHACLKRS